MSDLPVLPPLLILALAFGVAWLMAPLMERVARRYGFMDRPHPRRDAVLKPRLGGVAMYAAFAVALAATAPLVSRDAAEVQKVVGILVGGAIVLVVGVIDDWLELPPLPLLAAQVLAAAVAIAAGVVITAVTNPFGDPLTNSMLLFPAGAALLFTVFWIVGAMNTINFLDGVDGLAAGVGAIAAAVLGVHSLLMGQYSIAALAAALAGCCLGFLPHNFFPARSIMGTSGAGFLGFALGTLAIIGGAKTATLLLVLGLPIVDTGWAILRRLAAGRSPFVGDRGHLHLVLVDLGWSPAQIVLLMYGVSGTLGALALVLASRMQKLIAIGGMTVLLVVGLMLVAQVRGRTPAGRPHAGALESMDPPKPPRSW
ncbi:MAG: undecaprenyl/decaprenyl-phosphate alpha-N-acetylglucosaminyl 1-phosphate transferase [Chloroflexi bacterium]|nr:undecaprenyl/decaprenyl-phosphate alpha-N-acetylglucosaminyl 1-phosphate transferase [Chloroflexota bacterium]